MRNVVVSAVGPSLWGTSFLVTTQLLPEDRPLLAGALRALPAGLLLLGGVFVATRRSVAPAGSWWWRAAVLGVLNIGIFFALLFLAAYRLPGGIAALAGAVGPFIVAGLAFAILGERSGPRVLLAAAIGAAGLILLLSESTVLLDGIGLVAALGGTAVMGLGTVLGRKWGAPPGHSVLVLTGWQLVAGGAFLVPLTLLIEGPPPALTGRNILGYAYLCLIGTVVAQTLWFRGVLRLRSTQVTMLALLSPAVATLLGWVVLDESLSAWQLLGVVAVVAAVAVGVSVPRRVPSVSGAPIAAGWRA